MTQVHEIGTDHETLRRASLVAALAEKQINALLKEIGRPLGAPRIDTVMETLRAATFLADPVVREIVTSPLLLSARKGERHPTLWGESAATHHALSLSAFELVLRDVIHVPDLSSASDLASMIAYQLRLPGRSRIIFNGGVVVPAANRLLWKFELAADILQRLDPREFAQHLEQRKEELAKATSICTNRLDKLAQLPGEAGGYEESRPAIEAAARDVVHRLKEPVASKRTSPCDGIAPQSTITSARAEYSHSDDFRSVNWFGETYHFNASQAACIRLLWDHFERGNLAIHQSTIGDKIGSTSECFRLKYTFRLKNGSPHPAWKRMIVHAGKGSYRLQKPAPTARSRKNLRKRT